MFQGMIEILALYNDLFSSLGVDLKIVLELLNKERTLKNTSLTRHITQTKNNLNFDRGTRELGRRFGALGECGWWGVG